jgi:predicted transcriptional regulator
VTCVRSVSSTNETDCHDITEKFEDTKGAIRIRISKKNRQHNGQKKKYKRTNNDILLKVVLSPYPLPATMEELRNTNHSNKREVYELRNTNHSKKPGVYELRNTNHSNQRFSDEWAVPASKR